MKALPCKTCGKDPIFPFEPMLNSEKKTTFLQYKFESKCDCSFNIGYTLKIYNEARFPTQKEMEPLIKWWNEINLPAESSKQ